MNAAPAFIICEKCGYSTNEPVGDDGITSKVGRCCENLPSPYEYEAGTGMYTFSPDRAREERRARMQAIVGPPTEAWHPDTAPTPDDVDSQVGLSEAEYDDLWALWDDRNPDYMNRIRELGWTS